MHVETSCFVFVKIFQEINIFLVLDSLMLVHFSLKNISSISRFFDGYFFSSDWIGFAIRRKLSLNWL